MQIVTYTLCVICAFLCSSWKNRMARPATGRSMGESDLELGTLNVGEGAAILGTDNGLAVDMANTRVSTPEARIPTPEPQCENVTEDGKREATVPVVSHNQQVEVVAGKEI